MAGAKIRSRDGQCFHHSDTIERLCTEAGVMLLYLPSYSPGLNPIDEFFAPYATSSLSQLTAAAAECLGRHVGYFDVLKLHAGIFNVKRLRSLGR